MHISVSANIQFESSHFEGRNYYLSLPTPLPTVNVFQDKCRDVAGYLAEIDTREEYEFIMEFLKQSIPEGRDTALVGANDLAVEGRWVFMRSGKGLTYFDWKREAGGGEFNCMYLVWNSQDAGMHDWKCVDKELRRYVCEVPTGQYQ